MKFMLMMNAPQGTGDWEIFKWKPEEVKAHMAFMHRFNKDLRASGEFVACEGLSPPLQARIVHAGKTGEPVVTDGPFAESKEFLAGYWIVDVESAKQAYALAAKISTAPGPGGTPLNLPLEVREVMSGLPTE